MGSQQYDTWNGASPVQSIYLKLGMVGILYLATPRGLIHYSKTAILEQNVRIIHEKATRLFKWPSIIQPIPIQVYTVV